MSEMNEFTFDRLLEALAEKLATKLSQDPSRLYPSRLLTIEQAASYLGLARETTQHWARSGSVPTVLAAGRVFIDRLDLDRWIEDNKMPGY